MRAALFVATLTIVGCFTVDFADGELRCNPDPARACPSGYHCEPSTNSCFHDGHAPDLAAGSTLDGAGDGPATFGDGGAAIKHQGERCSAVDTCATGLACVDGYCCDNAACTGCRACNVTGKEGTCTTVPAGQDPHGFCTTVVCAAGGCDGNGACSPAPSTVACAYSTTMCSNIPAGGGVGNPPNQYAGATTMATFCSGTAIGTCAGATGMTGCPMQLVCAGAMSCKASCSNDADCTVGYFCSAGDCKPFLAVGQSCTRDTQCGNTAVCVNGVCRMCRTSRDCYLTPQGDICGAANSCRTCQNDPECVSAGLGDHCVIDAGGKNYCTCAGASSCTAASAPACAAGYCVCDPSTGFKCGPARTCISGVCLLLPGRPCIQNSNCASGNCQNGSCQ